jgi:hypothetical protein
MERIRFTDNQEAILMNGTVNERPSGRRSPARRLSRRSVLALAAGTVTQLTNVVDAIAATVTHPEVQRATAFLGPVLPWSLTGCAVVLGGLLILGGRSGDSLGRRCVAVSHELYQRALADGVDGGFLVAACEALIGIVVAPNDEHRQGEQE